MGKFNGLRLAIQALMQQIQKKADKNNTVNSVNGQVGNIVLPEPFSGEWAELKGRPVIEDIRKYAHWSGDNIYRQGGSVYDEIYGQRNFYQVCGRVPEVTSGVTIICEYSLARHHGADARGVATRERLAEKFTVSADIPEEYSGNEPIDLGIAWIIPKGMNECKYMEDGRQVYFPQKGIYLYAGPSNGIIGHDFGKRDGIWYVDYFEFLTLDFRFDDECKIDHNYMPEGVMWGHQECVIDAGDAGHEQLWRIKVEKDTGKIYAQRVFGDAMDSNDDDDDV